jgi:hypothetical protein
MFARIVALFELYDQHIATGGAKAAADLALARALVILSALT